MKKIISITPFLFFMAVFFNVKAVEPQTVTSAKNGLDIPIEVFYFHYSRRCATCEAVEAGTQKSLKELYAKEVKEGSIKFLSVNLDDKNNKALAKKHKVEGQALLVSKNTNRFDLTDQAFMYARTKPERLKAALKKAIDPLLK